MKRVPRGLSVGGVKKKHARRLVLLAIISMECARKALRAIRRNVNDAREIRSAQMDRSRHAKRLARRESS